MEIVSRWYFTKEVLENTPTRKCGIEASKELSYRQQAANFIQDMGQRLQVTQLCINTAIVYMHRFYMFHSFTKLHRNQLAVAALFLAAKVEEQPRKLEHVVRVAHKCLHRGEDLDPKSEAFMSKCSDLVSQENMMLQTLGFDIAIDHPHTYVVKLLQLVKDFQLTLQQYGRCTKIMENSSKDLAQTSYFMATNSLHLTTMCLQYRPTVVACVCIHLACKWSDWKIEPCSEGKEWYYYVDKSVTPELLEELTKDFLAVLEKSPNRLKRRVGPDGNKDGQISQSKCHEETVGRVDPQMYDSCMEAFKKDMSPLASTSSGPYDKFIKEEVQAKFAEPINVGIDSTSQLAALKKPKTEAPHSISLAVYREKREKERLSEQKPSHSAPVSVSLNNFTPAQASNVTAPPKFSISVKLEKNAVPIDDKRLVPNHEKLVVPNQEKLSSNPEKLLGLNLEKPTIPSQEKLIVPKQEKIIVSGHEKRLPHKPVATSIELVPQRMPEKSSHKSITSSSVSDAVSVDKVNHVIPKAMVAPMPQVNHQIPKVSVVAPAVKNIVQPKNDLSKITPDALKTNDPFVLLTRVDQTQIEKNVSDSKSGQRTGVPPGVSSKSLAPSRSDELRNKSRHHPTDPGSVLTNRGKEIKNSENPSSVKLKAKVNVLQNNHNDLQHSTQGNIVKHSPSWDIAKANGSKVLEQSVAELPLSYTMEPPKPVEKTVEVHNKHERREKHKHKHSVHSNKDKATNHVSELTSDQGMPSGLKITIPKEKLVLSGIRTDINPKSSALVKEESSRTTLKIKIPRPKPPVPESPSTGGAKANSTGPSLKLVITKDKNAGSYSASRKAERASRKRDRSPSSKVHNSRSSGKGGKFPKVDGVANASLPDPDNAARVNTMKQSNLDMVYNNLAQQPYMMPYNSQPYFQQFCPYPIPPTNVQYGYPPLPPQPHSTNSVPPLPRDPPPPLPPQPPMTSE